MYNHIWKKYLPFINIQLKRSAAGEQVMALNRVDFERAGTGRKAGYKFTIKFNQARVSNVISGSPLAMHLAAVMMEDENTKNILRRSEYEISLNTKFQLITKDLNAGSPVAEEPKATVEEEVTAE